MSFSKAVSQAFIESFFSNASLYSATEVSDDDQGRHQLYLIEHAEMQFDCHCTGCNRDSVFKCTDRDGPTLDDYFQSSYRKLNDKSAPHPSRDPLRKSWYKRVVFTCTRDATHFYIYELKFGDHQLMKYGQYPSVEDISSADIKRFRKVLPNDYFVELKKAGGLFSHGIGIGAFVYLRRIFEKLIFDHYEEFQQANDPVDGFATLRMDEKIAAIAPILPSTLVKNRAIYAILSKGIHELSEDECKKYFPAVRSAIIAILEQDLAEKEKAEAEKRMASALADIVAELKG